MVQIGGHGPTSGKGRHLLRVAWEWGTHPSQDDISHREVIGRLLCLTVLVKDEISKLFGIDFDDYFAPELERLKVPWEMDWW